MTFFTDHYETIEELMTTQDQEQARAVLKKLEQLAYAGFETTKNQEIFEKAVNNFKKAMAKIA